MERSKVNLNALLTNLSEQKMDLAGENSQKNKPAANASWSWSASEGKSWSDQSWNDQSWSK